MNATIAVIAAITEKKKFSDRDFISQGLLSLRSLESGFMMIAMITAIAEVFCFSATAAITAMVAMIWKPALI